MSRTALRHPARAASTSLLRLQSDERLAELAVAGHDAAFDAIVLRYRPALLRYCGAIVGSSRAEDAVQQTLLNAHAALADADEVRHLRSWLYRIAHNVSLNVLRGVRDEVPLDGDGVALPVSPGPSEAYESSERFRATVAALRALPENQRAALVLRELEGRSHEEIAEALGVTAGSARQHLMRARVAMRGAVTAVTPWGLIVRLAELASASGGGSGDLETAAGAGLGAGLAKLTAGVMATGALVGGAAVGTHEVVRNDAAAPARADTIHAAKRVPAARTRVVSTPTTTTAVVVRTTPRTTTRHHEHAEAEHHRGRDRGRRGRGGHDDDNNSSNSHGSSQPVATPLTDDNPHSEDSHSGSSRSSSGSSGSSNRGRGHTEDSTTIGSSSSGSSGSGSSGSSSSGSNDSGSSGSSGADLSGSVSSGSGPGSPDSSGSSSSGSSGSGSSGSSGSSGDPGASDGSGSGTSGDDGSGSHGSDDG